MSYWTSRMIANLSIDLSKEHPSATWAQIAKIMRDLGVETYDQIAEAERRARGDR